MEPTHALYVVDNWDGEGDKYWLFAYLKDGVFFSTDTDRKVLAHEGDKILKEVSLRA